MRVNNQIPPNSYFSALRFRFPVYHFFYLSNALSMLRILLVPAIYWSLVSGHMVMLFFFGGAAFISDMLDGFFARRLDQRSELGKVLDPIADKLTIAFVSFALILSRKPGFDANFPVWHHGSRHPPTGGRGRPPGPVRHRHHRTAGWTRIDAAHHLVGHAVSQNRGPSRGPRNSGSYLR